MKTIMLVGALALALAGCAANPPPTVIGHCELPENLATKDTVEDLDASHPIPQDQANVLWAKDRSHLSKAVKHGNDTIDWVAGHCN